jgi:hypothetical protein
MAKNPGGGICFNAYGIIGNIGTGQKNGKLGFDSC